MSVIVVSAMVYHIGGIGRLGVKSQHFINVLGTFTIFRLRRTLEHVPQVFLLLDLLGLHELVVRYWGVLWFFQVVRALRWFDRGLLATRGFKRDLTLFYGVEQGARIILSEILIPEVTGEFPPIVLELFLLYPLLPLSVFSAIEDFFDILDVEVIRDFFDIMFKDVGGVGLGVASV